MLLLSWFSVSFAKVLPSSFISFIYAFCCRCSNVFKIENESTRKWTRWNISIDLTPKKRRSSYEKKYVAAMEDMRHSPFNVTAFLRFFHSFHSCFTFTFHTRNTFAATFVRFLRSDAASSAPLSLPLYVFLFRWAADMCATRCEYTRKHLDAFKKRHGCLMERWKAREYSKENKCEVNVRDIVYDACTSWSSLCRLCALDILLCVVHGGSGNGADWNDGIHSPVDSDSGAAMHLLHIRRGISKEDRKNGKRKGKSFQVMRPWQAEFTEHERFRQFLHKKWLPSLANTAAISWNWLFELVACERDNSIDGN